MYPHAILSIILFFVLLVGNTAEKLFELEISQKNLASVSKDKNYGIVTEDCKNCLYFKGKIPYSRFILPGFLTKYQNKTVRIVYEYKIKDIPRPEQSWNGFKVMTAFYAGNKTYYAHTETPWGTKGWTKGSYLLQVKDNLTGGNISFSIPGGEAWISSYAIYDVDQAIHASVDSGICIEQETLPRVASGKEKKFRASLCKTSSPVAVDGKIAPAEYKNGVTIQGLVSDKTGEITYRDSIVYFARDEKFLYLALNSEIYYNIKPSNGDIAEFIVTAPNGKNVSLKLNALLRDAGNNLAVQAAVGTGSRFVAEAALPWELFGGSPENRSVWQIQIVRHWENPQEKGMLRTSGPAEFIFDDGMPGFSALKGVTEATHGSGPILVWQVANQQNEELNIGCEASVQWLGNPELVSEIFTVPPGKEHKSVLLLTAGNSGKRELVGKLSCNGQPLLAQHYTWSDSGLRWDDANPHVGWSSATYPSFKLAKARVYCDKSFKLDQMKEVRFRILSLDGKQEFYNVLAPRTELGFHKEWSIKDLPEGEYEIHADMHYKDGTLRTYKSRISYRTFPWNNNDIGLERVVIPPFKALTVTSDTVSATLTGYKLGGKGIFSEIYARGENILSGPVTLNVNGKPLTTDKVSFLEKSPDRVVAQTVLSSPETDVYVKYDIDYDGFILTDLNFRPKNGNFQSVTLDIPYRGDIAQMLHTVAAQLRRNPTVKIADGKGVVWDCIRNSPAYFRPYIWLGEKEKGLSWLCESELNWHLDRTRPMSEVIRMEDSSVILRIHLVNTILKRQEPFRIEMGFQASPVKPIMPNYRKYSTVSVGGFVPDKSISVTPSINETMWGADYRNGWCCGYSPANNDYSFIDFMCKEAKYAPDAKVTVEINRYLEKNSYPEKDRQKYRSHMEHAIKNLVRNTSLVIPYLNPRGMSKEWPEFKSYQAEWRNDNFVTGNAGPYFQNPVKSYRDYVLPQIRELVRHGFHGVYFDNTYDSVNEDSVMGPAVEYKLMRYRYHHTMLEMRRLIKRVATMLYTEGKLIEGRPFIILHMTNSAVLPVLSFASHQLDWEAYYGNSDYQDRFNESYVLAESTGLQSGCVPQVLIDGGKNPQHLQQTALALQLPYCLLDYYIGHTAVYPEYAAAINAVRNFGFGDRDIKIYPAYDTNNPLKISGNVRVALLLRGKEAMLMAGDFGSGGSFSADVGQLNYRAPIAFDALSGKEIGRGNSLNIPINRHYSKLVIVADGEDAAHRALARTMPPKNK